jgi:hypothetical protein
MFRSPVYNVRAGKIIKSKQIIIIQIEFYVSGNEVII